MTVAALVGGVAGVSAMSGDQESRAGTEPSSNEPAGELAVGGGEQLEAGHFLVGADKTSLTPAPEAYQPNGDARTSESQPSAQWVKEQSKCHPPSQDAMVDPTVDPNEPHAGLFPDSSLGWPHNPNCIYLGGFGIGPLRAATGVSEFGPHVRSIAIGNGAKTVIFQVLDTVGYFHRYRPDVCDGCGLADMRRAISNRLGLGGPEYVSIASTHTHGGADTYGGWGGVPKWYWHQMRDATIESAVRAAEKMAAAEITVGTVDARKFNSQRRAHYYSTADYWAHWLQAWAPDGQPIATLINHAAHPTTIGASNTLLHADWPGGLNTRLESIFPGSVSLTIAGGLGNVSNSGGFGNMTTTFANFLSSEMARTSTPLVTNAIAARQAVITHPMTNWAEMGVGAIGGFDREFTPNPTSEDQGGAGPSAYHWSRGQDGRALRGCTTASPVAIDTPVAAYRIGGLKVFTGPGELFSNLTEVVKSKTVDRSTAGRDPGVGNQTMVFGNTNDALGYIMQSFEFERTSNAATHYGIDAIHGESASEYEEFFALDACFGDHVLQQMLDLNVGL